MAGRKQLAYSANSETAKIKKVIEVFELENPLLKSLPTEYRKLYDDARRADIAAGIQPVDFQWQGDPWTSWSGGKGKAPKVVNRYHYNLQQKIKKAKRDGKFIELEDYLNHPSLKDDPELAKQLFEHNNKQLKRVSRFSSTKLHDDHVSPRSKAEYGWEVGRNKQLLGADDNLAKGAISPSDELLQKLGIGKTKAEQIDLLRSSPIDPDTGGRYTPRKVRELVSKDIGIPFKKGMGISEQALALVNKAKDYKAVKVISKAAKNPLVKKAGFVVPVAGLTIASGIVATDVQAATRNPSAKNYAKLGLSTFDAGLEVVDTFTAGLSTPVTMALQLASGIVRHQIEHGTTPSSERDWDARKASRRGQS